MLVMIIRVHISIGGGSESEDPQKAINHTISNKSIKTFIFPPDMAKYHFTIIETDYQRINPTVDQLAGIAAAVGTNIAGAPAIVAGVVADAAGAPRETVDRIVRTIRGTAGINLSAQKRYKLPLPTPLSDSFEVDYEQNFSYLSTAVKAGSSFTGGLLGAPASRIGEGLGAVGQIAGAATGITLNQFKTVTMNTPKYREFNLNWKLAPKTFNEAQEIQRIIFNLRKGMTPSIFPGNKVLLHFPKIYLMYFSPNIKYLYKFKPCVLKSLVVDYNGGAGHPAFYKPYSQNEMHSPPESVVVTTSWLELEYWLASRTDDNGGDYKTDAADGLPTNDPFDAHNFYNLNIPQQPTNYELE